MNLTEKWKNVDPKNIKCSIKFFNTSSNFKEKEKKGVEVTS